jgi:hypothetical protein
MNIWFPEGLYLSALAYSSLLMTSALFFYHMVRVQSMEMNPVLAGIVAITLLIVSVVLVGVSISVYRVRIREMSASPSLTETQHMFIQQEWRHWTIYLVLGIAYMLVQVVIAVYITIETLKHLRTRLPSDRKRNPRGLSGV